MIWSSFSSFFLAHIVGHSRAESPGWRGGGEKLEMGGWRIESHQVGFPEGCQDHEMARWKRGVIHTVGEEKCERHSVGEEAQVGSWVNEVGGLSRMGLRGETAC